MATGKTDGHIGNSPLSDMKGIFMSHGMRGMRGMGTGPKVIAGLIVVHISWVMFFQMDHCLLVIQVHYFHWINKSRVLNYSYNF